MDWLSGLVIAYPVVIAVGGLLARHTPDFGLPWWAWNLVVALPVQVGIFSLALGWPWWATTLYFALILVLAVYARVLLNLARGD